MEDKCGFLYTLGKEKCSIVFMEKISTLPVNHRSYVLKIINKFFGLTNLLDKIWITDDKRYLAKLIYDDCFKSANKYLIEMDQKTYLQNVMQTRLKKLNLIKRNTK
jgi:hypothetical protein